MLASSGAGPSGPPAPAPGCPPAGGPVGTTKSRLAHQREPADGAHEGDHRADVHQVVQGGGEADLVGAEQRLASGCRRDGRQRGAHASGRHGALELRAAVPQDLGAEGRLVQRGSRVRQDLALEHRAEHGDAGGDADLAERVVGARGHAAALGLDDGHRARGQHWVDDPRPRSPRRGTRAGARSRSRRGGSCP